MIEKYLVRAYVPYSGIWFEQGSNDFDKALKMMDDLTEIGFKVTELFDDGVPIR